MQPAPHNIELEQALLGSLMLDSAAFERAGEISASVFYDSLHQRIFTTIEKHVHSGGIPTPLVLHAAMREDGGLKEIGGIEYLASLAESAPALPNVRNYAEILRELATRRRLIHYGEDVAVLAYDATVSTTRQIQTAEQALYEFSTKDRYGEGAISFSTALTRTIELAQKAQSRGGKISGVSTGFADIDALLGGLQASDLLIIAGRPGMGKTALATNIAFHAARNSEAGCPVLFFSLEMAAQQLSARVLAEQSQIEMWKIRNGKFSESEWETFVLAMQEIAEIPLYIDDTGGITLPQIAARARRAKREKNIGCVIIDYLQLITAAHRAENRVQEVTEITKGLKALAKELDIPILALSQLSRGVDNRDDKRPVLSDLRESGSIEQDADVVMFVYREEYYLKSREPNPGSADHAKWMEKMERAHRRAEVLVEKHRHGATNKIDLFFDDRFTKFSNLVRA